MAKKVAPAQLFAKFGEFDSVEELNRAAAGLREEGDVDGLKELAKENGIDPFEVEDYIDGMSEELATPITAALGRMEVELDTLDGQIKNICLFYSIFVNALLTESKEVAKGIMKKGARLKGIYDAIYAYARKHQQGGCFAGSTTDQQDKQLVKAYYTGQDLNQLFDQWFGQSDHAKKQEG